MPMKPGSSKKAISSNIKELKSSGRDMGQAIAIALNHADKKKSPKKGVKK